MGLIIRRGNAVITAATATATATATAATATATATTGVNYWW